MTRVAAMLAVLAIAACDDREAIHDPDPTLARMLDQRRADPYEAWPAFPDGKVMQEPPHGTVARDDDADEPRPPLDRALLEVGRAHFEVVCATCHGVLGDGNSVVATKMEHRPPTSLHEPRIRALPPERIFAVASEGYGLMPAYAPMLSARERWAIVAYVRALQLSQAARVADLPESARTELAKEAR